MDAFCRVFPQGANAQVLLAIIRKTYGYQKKEDAISISQIGQATGLSRRTVIYCLQNLEAKRMITVKRERGRGKVNQINRVALQKNHELWVVQRNSEQYDNQLRKQREKYHEGVVQRMGGSAKNGKKVVQRIEKGSANSLHPQKKTITKENLLQKKVYGEFQNVLLTNEEYQKLKDKLNHTADELIEEMSAAISSKGYKYKSHYAALLNWDRKRRRDGKAKGHFRKIPDTYSKPPTYDD